MQNTETNRIENKEQLNDDFEQEVIAFLNYKEGGIIYVGINKNGQVVGVENTDLTQLQIKDRIKNNIQFEFVEVSSYENNESTGKVKLNKDITQSIEGKEVIIIEDIVDTGRTLAFLKELLLEKKPASLKICSLLDKPSRRIANVKADYVGFAIEDKFVVGYGLDDEQNHRNLNYIGYIEE